MSSRAFFPEQGKNHFFQEFVRNLGIFGKRRCLVSIRRVYAEKKVSLEGCLKGNKTSNIAVVI